MVAFVEDEQHRTGCDEIVDEGPAAGCQGVKQAAVWSWLTVTGRTVVGFSTPIRAARALFAVDGVPVRVEDGEGLIGQCGEDLSQIAVASGRRTTPAEAVPFLGPLTLDRRIRAEDHDAFDELPVEQMDRMLNSDACLPGPWRQDDPRPALIGDSPLAQDGQGL